VKLAGVGGQAIRARERKGDRARDPTIVLSDKASSVSMLSYIS
jgi:hypothetical protein